MCCFAAGQRVNIVFMTALMDVTPRYERLCWSVASPIALMSSLALIATASRDDSSQLLSAAGSPSSAISVEPSRPWSSSPPAGGASSWSVECLWRGEVSSRRSSSARLLPSSSSMESLGKSKEVIRRWASNALDCACSCSEAFARALDQGEAVSVSIL